MDGFLVVFETTNTMHSRHYEKAGLRQQYHPDVVLAPPKPDPMNNAMVSGSQKRIMAAKRDTLTSSVSQTGNLEAMLEADLAEELKFWKV
ncbi:hypothetical protein SBRCBS47491_002124 [Sporothrix bragantina]|uniref:Uncharacterized protein n=1 Tax=Sporothrix bragantina TaxID=671064 RepID=A0ABP0B4I0_9PEZI